jgi:hypothetical protein
MNEFKLITTKEGWCKELKNYKTDWYHTWSYHEMAFKRSEGKPILFVLTNKIYGSIAIPLLLRNIKFQNKYKDMTSVYGYPGFVFSSESARKLYSVFIEQLKTWSKKNFVVSIFSRQNSLLIDPKNLRMCSPNGETVVVNLNLNENEQRARYRSVHRNLLRRLENNGFSANWSRSKESIEDFKTIYIKTMKALDANEYYFFDNYYYNDLLKSDEFEVRIYNVCQNRLKVCSGIFIFYRDIVQYHLSGVLQEYKKFSPTLMLIDKARKDATELGFKYLHLGGGLGVEKDGLFNFKYGFSKNSIKFYFFKMITDINSYKKLSNLPESESIPKSGYFPLYRKNND